MGRKDSKRCNDIKGMTQILIDLKPKRSLGELYINEVMDVTELVKYTKKLQKKDKDITFFHVVMMSMGKVIYNRPLLNRFVANRHVYEHNDVTIGFVMKVSFDDKSKEIMVIMPILEDDDVFTLSERIKDKVDSIRNKKDDGKGANDAINFLGKLPNIVRVPLIGLLKWTDKYGILPLSLVQDNLYYSSMIVSNIGSLKCNGIYHNLTDFGTSSGLITVGEVKEIKEGKDTKYVCEFGMTMDERVGDGFYFIKSIKLMQYIFNNPALLEEPADKHIDFE